MNLANKSIKSHQWVSRIINLLLAALINFNFICSAVCRVAVRYIFCVVFVTLSIRSLVADRVGCLGEIFVLDGCILVQPTPSRGIINVVNQ